MVKLKLFPSRDSEIDIYDIVVIGGGIAGSVASILLSKKGKKVLLVEKEATPRHKTCSGIQFPYFEKLLGIKIPRTLDLTPLTKTQLTHTEIDYPPTSKGKRKNLVAAFPMLNFMRNSFDHWLNLEAMKAGAEFKDKTRFIDLKEKKDYIEVYLAKSDEIFVVKTRYLIGADGVNSSVRKKMRPDDFSKQIKSNSGGINYYIKPIDETTIKIPKTTLLQIWNVDYNDLMFAWVYIKDEPRCSKEETISDKCTDAWVVGTAYENGEIEVIGKKLLDYVAKVYGLKGEILRTEKLVVNLDLNNPSKRFAFGDGNNGNILYVGDAAGLIDAVRGLGMDAAAISAHKAVHSIIEAEIQQISPLDIYSKKMKRVKKQLERGTEGAKGVFVSNDDLMEYLEKSLNIVAGLKKIVLSKTNNLKNPEDMDLV